MHCGLRERDACRFLGPSVDTASGASHEQGTLLDCGPPERYAGRSVGPFFGEGSGVAGRLRRSLILAWML